jgi:membrane-associated phospholipid phosphatase
MSRGIGELKVIQKLVPEWSAPLWGLLTQLGDLWFVVVLFSVLYWYHPDLRKKLLSLSVAVVIGAVSFVSLKLLFAMPRPDSTLLVAERVPEFVRPVYRFIAYADGYGFPSGHATISTVVYFGLASILTLWDQRRRYLAAAAIVGLISFTRVVLGLHYLVDVLAGIALGGVVLVSTLLVLARTSWLR